MAVLSTIGDGLWAAFQMAWEVAWALVLGFALSGIVQAVVSKSEMTRLLPDDSPKCLTIATGLGVASSSCSYAAVALARSIFRKGADFTSAMAFEFASTNLVVELGIILFLLMGWEFVTAEYDLLGTMRGEFLGHKPTGKAFRIKAVSIPGASKPVQETVMRCVISRWLISACDSACSAARIANGGACSAKVKCGGG